MEHPLKAVAAITNRVPKRNIEKTYNANSHWLANRVLSCLGRKHRTIQDQELSAIGCKQFSAARFISCSVVNTSTSQLRAWYATKIPP